MDGVANQVVDGGGAIEDGSGADDRAALDDGAFVDAAIAAHQDVVLDDHRHGAHRLQHAADLAGGRDVAVPAHLRAASHQGVRIHHGSVVHPGAHVDVHGRHTYHALADIAAVADAGTAGHDAHVSPLAEALDRECGFVEERLAFRIDRHVDDRAHAEAQQDALFHPGIHAPAGAGFGARLRGAYAAFVERGFEPLEQEEILVGVDGWFLVEEALDFSLQGTRSSAGRRPPEPWRCAPG